MQFQKFKLWVVRMVNYEKINKIFAFIFIMKDVKLKAYTMNNHTAQFNEIVWEFYAHFEPPKIDHLAYSQVRG